MKERNIYGDDFEKQLKEKADQFKMYPSDKVWNEVHSSLHTRRRRFVAGMSFLIGSILILAGSQLISPAKISTPKPVTTIKSSPSKPATAADLRTLTENSITSGLPDNSAGHLANGNPNIAVPFMLQSLVLLEQESTSEDMQEYQPVKMQPSARIRTQTLPDLNVAGKSESLLTSSDLNESELLTTSNAVANTISTDLVPEKSVTQLTHIRNDRFSWEIYIAPMMTAHYLNGMSYQNLSQSVQSAPIMVGYFTNVNGFVDNTPLLGYDVGGNVLYKISKNISLKAGLEFSFSRYYIKAFNSNPGQASATLNSYFGYIADSLVNSNSGGINKNPQHYQNRYYQVSIPVGVVMKVAGARKVQLHLGATLQPSYLLNTDAYVLSDDYSTYVKDPNAFRRWNLIAGAEAYISYGVGKMRWELGPQVRYQIFSTYKNSAPLSENMLNYGIRIGISKTIR
jgi:hypothetical protein